MSEAQENPTYTWTPSEGRLKGMVCTRNGREWGMVFASSSAKHGSGWSSTYGGFFQTLEDAQAGHEQAVEEALLKISSAATAQKSAAPPPRMSVEERCKAAGIPFVNYRALRAKKLDEANEARRSGPRFR